MLGLPAGIDRLRRMVGTGKRKEATSPGKIGCLLRTASVLAAASLHAEDAIAYTRDAHDAIQQVRSGAADLAVLVNATRVDQVAAVALAGERMPEKSTYFYPKAPTGLVFRPLE